MTFEKIVRTNAGTYPVPYAIDPYDSDNYNIIVTGGNYIILTRPVTVTIADKTRAYNGDDVTVGSVQGVDWTVTQGNVIDGDDLGIALSIEPLLGGLKNVGKYTIVGSCDNQNYAVTFANGAFTVTKADNAWSQEYSVEDFEEDAFKDGGDFAPESMPKAKFGDAIIAYYLDEEHTQLYEGDIRDAFEGVYYVKVTVEDTDNYGGLESYYTVHVLHNALSSKQDLDIGGPLLMMGIEFVTGLCALIFVKRRKQNSNKQQ